MEEAAREEAAEAARFAARVFARGAVKVSRIGALFFGGGGGALPFAFCWWWGWGSGGGQGGRGIASRDSLFGRWGSGGGGRSIFLVDSPLLLVFGRRDGLLIDRPRLPGPLSASGSRGDGEVIDHVDDQILGDRQTACWSRDGPR